MVFLIIIKNIYVILDEVLLFLFWRLGNYGLERIKDVRRFGFFSVGVGIRVEGFFWFDVIYF